MSCLFVGERPSRTAERIGASWERGGVCATTLHDALRANGVEPAQQHYINLFAPGDGTLVVDPDALAVLHRSELPIVALGRRVQSVLTREGIPFHALTHPAARGRIRRRDRYQAHVGAVLATLSTNW